MNLKNVLIGFVEDAIKEHEDLFLVAVDTNNENTNFSFLIDGDNGIGIDSCVKISRKVSKRIDEEIAEEKKFVFEVSSPGADKPLLLPRQYNKHIGRTIKITDKENNIFTGKLKEANKEKIVLELKPEKKKQQAEEKTLLFANIKEARIIISFK